jgi:hypothetical protein
VSLIAFGTLYPESSSLISASSIKGSDERFNSEIMALDYLHLEWKSLENSSTRGKQKSKTDPSDFLAEGYPILDLPKINQS